LVELHGLPYWCRCGGTGAAVRTLRVKADGGPMIR
jgi:hypothetical protein